MLLLIGDPDDLTLTYVHWLAYERGHDVVVLPERSYGHEWWAIADHDRPGSERLALVVDGRPLDLGAVTGAFVRMHPSPPLPDGLVLGRAATDLYLQQRRSAVATVADRLPCTVVNRPRAGRSNGAKPLHMTELAAAGFDVPAWVASNDPAAVDPFLAAHCPDGAVVKAASGLRSQVRLVDETFRRRLADGTSPAVVQRYVRGHEVRVHVIGDATVGSRVDAATVDYRFDEQPVRYRTEPVPDDIARRCRDHAARHELLLAGLDFRVDADGRWWCLEMNPVPTFLPYEVATGHPIGPAVVDLLTGRRPRTTGPSPLATGVAA